MQGNKKILTITSIMLLIFSILVVGIFSINFKNFTQEQEMQKAQTVAMLVKDGLTAHMVSGTMDQRDLFLDNVKESSGALKIWLFRSQKVIDQYGKGSENEIALDEIDKKVIKTTKTQHVIKDAIRKSTLRVTIPYIATNNQKPNCLSCHTNAKVGDVLILTKPE